MSGRPHHAHRAAPGFDPSVRTVLVRCTCGSLQEEPLERNKGIAEQLPGTSCLFCGRLGGMTQVKK